MFEVLLTYLMVSRHLIKLIYAADSLISKDHSSCNYYSVWINHDLIGSMTKQRKLC